jgi:hypothetical protein
LDERELGIGDIPPLDEDITGKAEGLGEVRGQGGYGGEEWEAEGVEGVIVHRAGGMLLNDERRRD